MLIDAHTPGDPVVAPRRRDASSIAESLRFESRDCVMSPFRASLHLSLFDLADRSADASSLPSRCVEIGIHLAHIDLSSVLYACIEMSTPPDPSCRNRRRKSGERLAFVEEPRQRAKRSAARF